MYDKGYTTISALEPHQRSLENAKAVLEELRLKNQIERKGVSEERRVELRKAVERAKSNLERIGQRRKRRLEGIETQISAEEKNLEVIRYTIAHAQEQIDNASVYAPCDGVFKLLVYRDWTAGGLMREVQVGDEKRPEDVVGHIIDPSDMMVKLVVNESDFPVLKVGMPVTMTVPSFPGKVFHGKIRQLGAIGKDRNRIDPIAAGGGDSEVIMFNAAVDFDGQGVRFHPGMSADIKVNVLNYSEALFIPRAAVIDRDGRHFVFISTYGSQKQISGRNFNDMMFQVNAGLEEGERIFIRQNRQK
jgi:multidrug efflux pump subunit AcrA (membrane-fusion protein)